MRHIAMFLVSFSAVTALVSCNTGQSDSHPSNAVSTEDALATVNGVPIFEEDVVHALDQGGHEKREITPQRRKNVLENIIRDELVYQRAVELGLDDDSMYQAKLRRKEAQLNAFKREEIADVFFRREVAGKADVSEEEARAYFAENQARIQTEVHVWQILRRDEGEIEQVRKEIEAGEPFEEVAARVFSTIPAAGRKPWDLGYLKWSVVPEPWQDFVYKEEIGAVSGVIRGPNERFWVIQLVDRRENPEITFEAMQAVITNIAKNESIEELRTTTDQQLRETAVIEYAEDLIGEPGTPTADETPDRSE